MIVMPSLSSRDQRNEPIVAAVLSSFVAAIAKEMGETVDAPCDVPYENGSDENAPQRDARCEERGISD